MAPISLVLFLVLLGPTDVSHAMNTLLRLMFLIFVTNNFIHWLVIWVDVNNTYLNTLERNLIAISISISIKRGIQPLGRLSSMVFKVPYVLYAFIGFQGITMD
ncbi:uncharacterized protein EV154DRAFT_478910 [Mucor mucedo]|uniref:uncharacterized protein n=1 Tax=Mucor mucedo TaxID=29922 RepID=UPI002220EC86|nr:uncharacterized protein EV154DRAFT_478910 [Mucor mucedo]KAI7893860.1 hypothetical protein EV154DRAFT_478910 [Mucor mucedo]